MENVKKMSLFRILAVVLALLCLGGLLGGKDLMKQERT